MTTQITTALFERSKYNHRYPPGVCKVDELIEGTSFFPGGHGLWMPNGKVATFPHTGVMVLGHDFHSEAGYRKSLKNKQEDLDGPTWGPLIALLQDVEIPLENCFFTNAYMGLREGAHATGKFPGRSDCHFVCHCQNFFMHQLAVQRPAIILALGNHVPAFLEPLAPELSAWRKCNTFKKRDMAGCSVVKDVQLLAGSPSYRATIVTLTHPSFRRLNVHRRAWNGFEGNEAEIEMIKHARANSAYCGPTLPTISFGIAASSSPV